METITNLAEFLTRIAEKKAYPKGLRLNLANNKLGAEGAKALALALQSGQCPQGLQLDLWKNQLGAEGAKALAVALQSGQCPQWLQLNLDYNELGAEGAKALAIALQSGQCPQGLELYLCSNLLGDEGVKALAVALQSGQCPPGLQLDLSINQLGAEGAKALAMALQSGQCPQGLQLNLWMNQLGAEGAKALAVALQSGHCPPGLQLNFSAHQLDAEDKQILNTALACYEAQQQDNFIHCMTLYQGHNQVASLIHRLPREIVQEICSHILPATPILAKMTEISTKVFRKQLVALKLADTSEPARQLDNTLAAALSAKKLTEKAAQIKTAIHNFLCQEAVFHESQALINAPVVSLLQKFQLLTGNEKRSTMLSLIHQPDEPEGQSPLKKMRL